MKPDARTVHEAMQDAPHDDGLYRQARGAIGAMLDEERTVFARLEARIDALRGALERVRDKRVGPGTAVEAQTGKFCHECLRYVGSGYSHEGFSICGLSERAIRADDEAASR